MVTPNILRSRDYTNFMRLMITGGAGFLGSHLCRNLLSEGHEVLAVDNLYTGSKSNIADLIKNPNFEFLRHDITFPLFVEVDGIFNLACPASPKHYQKDPVQTLKTCVVGSINMLGIAKRLNIPILQASTSEVYGDPQVSPQNENYLGNVNPIGVRACYDEGKRAAETIFFDYKRQYNTEIRVARIFNTYGPNMAIDDGRVVSNFIWQALNNSPLTIFGDGSQTRSFCYVDDLINGLVKLFNSKNTNGPINLGNPRPISMLDLAKEIIALTNSNSGIEFITLPSDDPKQRVPDISNAQRHLDWTPMVNRKSGLIKTISYFSNLKEKMEVL
jgi:UDP-glucuronate decarboxylase